MLPWLFSPNPKPHALFWASQPPKSSDLASESSAARRGFEIHPSSLGSCCCRPYKAHWRHKSQAVLFIPPRAALPTPLIVPPAVTFGPAAATTRPFPGKLRSLRGSEELLGSNNEQRCPAGASDPAKPSGISISYKRSCTSGAGLSPELSSHISLKMKDRHISETQHLMRVPRAASSQTSGCKKSRPLTFTGIGLIAKKTFGGKIPCLHNC